MFVPSFFTGHLIRRFGPLPIMAAGIALNITCLAIALSGTDLAQFLGALIALGLGWNFVYIGGTTLFTEAYRPQQRTTAQAAMDTTVFATMTLTSFASGALVTTGGWTFMNLASLVPVALLALSLAWLVRRRRQAAAAATG